MTDADRLKIAIDLLVEARKAIGETLSESNGIFDNAYRHVGTNGKFDWEMEFPAMHFGKTIDDLSKTYETIEEFLEPDIVAARKRWENACSTGARIADLYRKTGDSSGLARNIADAINGTLRVEDGKLTETMQDALARLVTNGQLVEFKPADEA